jgi:GR25 family glycosyltransferase involved in LPS biosynthesis
MCELFDLPTFVINMDRCPDRLACTMERAREAGFTKVMRFQAVDATVDCLEDAWEIHGHPKKNVEEDAEFIEYPGKQGCMLSHLHLWKHIIDQQIEQAVVLEDDIAFHKQWATLAPAYWRATPKDYDILYLGSQLDVIVQHQISVVPVFCTHAYVITLQGAKRIYSLLVEDPHGVRTIDCMLIDHMKRHCYLHEPRTFTWYAWSGIKYPDPFALKDKDWAKRNTGLVFQDPAMGTFVRPW